MADSEEVFQSLLQAVGTWCNKNSLSINQSKSAIIHFRKKSAPISQYKFYLNDQNIVIQSRLEYLGTTSEEHLEFRVMWNSNLMKVKKALNVIKAKLVQ